MAETLYAGMAGDTDAGQFVSAGLYRKIDEAPWTRMDSGFTDPPEVHAILTDPRRPDRVMIGTQGECPVSDNCGETWRQLPPAPKPELAVWSLHRHPGEPDVIFAGYEPAALYRSVDNGMTWTPVGLAAAYPDVTAGPEMPKRITGIAAAGKGPSGIYLSLEIGGLLRSLDGGESWEAAIDGLYVLEDAVDLHGVVVSPAKPEQLTVTARVGTSGATTAESAGENCRSPRCAKRAHTAGRSPTPRRTREPSTWAPETISTVIRRPLHQPR